MNKRPSTLVGQLVTLQLSDPWDLGESISWKPLRCVVLNAKVRRTVSLGEAGEAILLRLREPFTFDDVLYGYLLGSPRHEGWTLRNLQKDGTKVACNFLRIPPHRLDEQNPFDSSWWRGGGGGLIGTLSLD